MSLYIHRENQTLLWNIMEKNPQFAKMVDKEVWFSNIIKQNYENIQYLPLTLESLQHINKQTISMMVDALKKMELQNTFLPSNSGATERISSFTAQFEERQKDYMIKPIEPPNVKFDKIDDDVITNMDELLQRQIKQREYDIAQTMPPPPNSSNEETIKPNKKVTWTSEKTNPSLENQIEDLKKTVQNLSKIVDELQKDMNVLKKQFPNEST
jgi:hypothetical protein